MNKIKNFIRKAWFAFEVTIREFLRDIFRYWPTVIVLIMATIGIAAFLLQLAIYNQFLLFLPVWISTSVFTFLLSVFILKCLTKLGEYIGAKYEPSTN